MLDVFCLIITMQLLAISFDPQIKPSWLKSNDTVTIGECVCAIQTHAM